MQKGFCGFFKIICVACDFSYLTNARMQLFPNIYLSLGVLTFDKLLDFLKKYEIICKTKEKAVL